MTIANGHAIWVTFVAATLVVSKCQCLADEGMFKVVAPVVAPPKTTVSRIKEGSEFCKIPEARNRFNASGKGMVVAVIDSGIADDHPDFTEKVVAQYDFVGKDMVADDQNGHGTHVSGIIAANSIHTGVAPNSKVVALKVFGSEGTGTFREVADALQWVLDNHEQFKISAVNMSLGDDSNSTVSTEGSKIRQLIIDLRSRRIPVVVAAGNYYYKYQMEGMTFPAICPECISVGAVFDANKGPYRLEQKNVSAAAFSTSPGSIAPFSQRLNSGAEEPHRTDIFAPGSTITSSGIDNRKLPKAEWNLSKDNSGTSMATPFVTGTVLLLQERFKSTHGVLPTVEQLETSLRDKAILHQDGSTEDDNVVHTGDAYPLLNAMYAFEILEGASPIP